MITISLQLVVVSLLIFWYYQISHKHREIQNNIDNTRSISKCNQQIWGKYICCRIVAKPCDVDRAHNELSAKLPDRKIFNKDIDGLLKLMENNFEKRVLLVPQNSRQVMLSLTLKSYCELHIAYTPKIEVKAGKALKIELHILSGNIMAYLTTDQNQKQTSKHVPLSVHILRLRALIRQYGQDSRYLEDFLNVSKALLTSEGSYDLVPDTHFIELVRDIAFCFGGDLETLIPKVLPRLISFPHFSNCESAILILVACVTLSVELAAILRFVTQQLLHVHTETQLQYKVPGGNENGCRNENGSKSSEIEGKSRIIYKILLVICLKDCLAPAHHVNIRHILQFLLESKNSSDINWSQFIFWKYQYNHPMSAKQLQQSLPVLDQVSLESMRVKSY